MTPREADRIAAFVWKDMGERRGFETLKEVTHETEVAIKSFWIEKFLALSPDQTAAPKQDMLFGGGCSLTKAPDEQPRWTEEQLEALAKHEQSVSALLAARVQANPVQLPRVQVAEIADV